MYSWGAVACFLVVILIGVCGCSAAQPGAKNGTPVNAAESTPTLPDRYTAGEETPSSEPVPVAALQTRADVSSISLDSEVKATLTEVSISCTGNSCTSGTTDNSSAGSMDNTGMIVPDSSFSANVTKAYFNQNPYLPVGFTATSNTAPYSWMWSWSGGNQASSSDLSLVLTFNQFGDYMVSRTVKNSNSTVSNSTLISVCPLITSFTADRSSGPVPLVVQFTDTSTNQPASWLWDFGDGTTSRLQNPSHTYTISGTHVVRLVSKNNFGSCWNTTEIVVSPLTASFTSNLTTGLVPLTVQFTDTSTDRPTSWSWDFGDGATSSLQNPAHTYTKPGTYQITLNVTNGYDGQVPAAPVQVTVYSLPATMFIAAPVHGVAGTAVLFTDTSTGAPAPSAWYWDFGDGYTSTYQNPSHQYAAAGVYTISHSATNTQGTAWQNKTAYISIS